MGDSFVKTVLLAVLLVLLCAACDGLAEESRKSGNIEPITTGQGANREDTQGRGGERVEVSILATDLEVPWSLAFLPGGDALVTERDSGRLLRVSPQVTFGRSRRCRRVARARAGFSASPSPQTMRMTATSMPTTRPA